MSTKVRYNESGGKLISVRPGRSVPAVRVSDGMMVLVRYDHDLTDGHYDGAVSEVDDERILAEFPGVELLRFVRTDMVRVQVPCSDLEGLRRTLGEHGLRLFTTHVDEVNGGRVWGAVMECLARHHWGPADWERRFPPGGRNVFGSPFPTVDDEVRAACLYRHGLMDGHGLTAAEIHRWIARYLISGKGATLEQTQTALGGLARIERVTVRQVDGHQRYHDAGRW